MPTSFITHLLLSSALVLGAPAARAAGIESQPKKAASTSTVSSIGTIEQAMSWLKPRLSASDFAFLGSYVEGRIKPGAALPKISERRGEFSINANGRVLRIRAVDALQGTFIVAGRELTLGPSRSLQEQFKELEEVVSRELGARTGAGLIRLALPEAEAFGPLIVVPSMIALGVIIYGIVDRVTHELFGEVESHVGKALSQCSQASRQGSRAFSADTSSTAQVREDLEAMKQNYCRPTQILGVDVSALTGRLQTVCTQTKELEKCLAPLLSSVPSREAGALGAIQHHLDRARAKNAFLMRKAAELAAPAASSSTRARQ